MSKVFNNHNGIAIGMVLTSIVILTTIIANFSFESNINKIKAYNIEDRGKAKLTAESGLQFAMARLRLYKEAYNFLQENDGAKDIVKQETLNILWNFPFIYPIPISEELNQNQKDSIEKFQETSFLDGTLNLTINNISNKINLNLIRVSLLAEQNKNEEKSAEEREKLQEFNVENQLFVLFNNILEKKREEDEDFFNRYAGIEVSELINDLKYYISDPNSVEAGTAERRFEENELSAKQAPIQSFSELYLLPSWNDELVNIIQNEFTVHGAIMIDLNKMTDKLLKLLIPNISDDEIKEFFKYKDDPEDPQFFNELEDFKNYIVNIGNIMSASNFEERFQNFIKQGLQFGPTPTLFKIVSTALKGRSTYTLTAYVVLPAKPKPRPKKETEKEPDETENRDGEKPEDDTEEPPKDETEKEKQKTLLLEPRIVEISVS